jgi:hypothetical protein
VLQKKRKAQMDSGKQMKNQRAKRPMRSILENIIDARCAAAYCEGARHP